MLLMQHVKKNLVAKGINAFVHRDTMEINANWVSPLGSEGVCSMAADDLRYFHTRWI